MSPGRRALQLGRATAVLALHLSSAEARAQDEVVTPSPPPSYTTDVPDAPPLDARLRTEGPTPSRPRARLALVSDGEPLTLLVRAGAGWTEICTTPCAAALPRGGLTLAIATEDAPLPIGREIVDADERWTLAREDRSRLRGTGWVLVVLGAALAAAGAACVAGYETAANGGAPAEERIGWSLGTALGLGAGALTVIGGLALTAEGDRARIERATDE